MTEPAAEAASNPPPAKRTRIEDAEEERIDPSDGQPYTFGSFAEVYGPEEGLKMWESAAPAGSGVTPATPAEPSQVPPKPGLPPAGRIRSENLFGASLKPVYGPGKIPRSVLTAGLQGGVKIQKVMAPYANSDTHYPEEFGSLPLESRVLLLGEGNFSLSLDFLAKCEKAGVGGRPLICSAYDSKEECLEKYPDVEQNHAELEKAGGVMHYAIDATSVECLQKAAPEPVDAVVFHFPHTGDKQHFHWNPGPEAIQKSIDNNVELLRNFFKAVGQALPTAHVFVTLKTNQPYCFWGLELQGAREGWSLQAAVPFNADHFPGYQHRRTQPNQNKRAKTATIKFHDAVVHHFVFNPEAAAARAAEIPDPQNLRNSAAKRPQPAAAAPNDGDEIRMDPRDGRYYTVNDFTVCYGGTAEWDAAVETSTFYSTSRFT
eukprot:Hpha_TRINITY_DN15481_c6_g16::TRINITY_DN15481_c6_g16_i1::g.174974::m.174974/K19307/BMT5; 25S rRNA (uracil2634-N3)-methyltransferase